MYTDRPNHEPSLYLLNSGEKLPGRPSMGSWLTYGLGTENQNLPGFVVLCPGAPVVGSQLWSSTFRCWQCGMDRHGTSTMRRRTPIS